MEPKIPVQPNQTNKNPSPDMNSTVSDLHDEGVDIVDQGSSEQTEETFSSDASEETEKGTSSENAELEAEIRESETISVAAPVPQQNPQSSTADISDIPRHVPPQAVQQMPTPIPVPKEPLQARVPETSQQQANARSAAQDEINQALGGSYSADGKPAAPTVQNDPSIKPLRTFKSDAEEAVRYQNISAAQIALAEQKKKESSTPIQYETEKKSSFGIIAFLLILLLVGGAGGYYWFFVLKQNPASALPQALRVQTILPYTNANTIQIDQDRNAIDTIAGALLAAEVEQRGIYALIPVPTGTTTSAAGINSILKDTNIPNMLDRSLGSDYMVGAYAGDTKDPFVILKNTYFQNAFAGMLEWEKDLRNDMISLIRMSRADETTTSLNNDSFEDVVISNIDARVLRNADGEAVLSYAFADKDTIVITTKTETLKTLLDKLLAVRIVQ